MRTALADRQRDQQQHQQEEEGQNPESPVGNRQIAASLGLEQRQSQGHDRSLAASGIAMDEYRSAMRYLAFLDQVHAKLAPQTYLEIGVRSGSSLALSRCRTVAIDPAFSITAEIHCDLQLFRTTSDEYFNRPDPLAATDGHPFDLAFIDGLHLLEFALRDFIHTERHSSPKSLIVFDDILPRNSDEASRARHTRFWTGDVYPIMAVLERYRPELTVIPVDTTSRGLLLVMGLDPQDSTLAQNYHEILAEYRHPDPQPVPKELLDRFFVLPPERVLDASFWSVLAEAGPDASPQQIRGELAEHLPSLGEEYVGRRAAGEAA
jgi:methyltransferase family protein